MTTLDFLTMLERQGFILRPTEEGKLQVFPASKLTDSLKVRLQERKTELLALLTRPYITDKGELHIPFTAPPRYHWWAGGQSIGETLVELNAPPEVWRRYVEGYTETLQ